jgi:damage-control phosphatase, subfamily I
MNTGNDCLVCWHSECLSQVCAPIFFLFLIKCTTVLAYLQERLTGADLKIGSAVLLRGDL